MKLSITQTSYKRACDTPLKYVSGLKLDTNFKFPE